MGSLAARGVVESDWAGAGASHHRLYISKFSLTCVIFTVRKFPNTLDKQRDSDGLETGGGPLMINLTAMIRRAILAAIAAIILASAGGPSWAAQSVSAVKNKIASIAAFHGLTVKSASMLRSSSLSRMEIAGCVALSLAAAALTLPVRATWTRASFCLWLLADSLQGNEKGLLMTLSGQSLLPQSRPG